MENHNYPTIKIRRRFGLTEEEFQRILQKTQKKIRGRSSGENWEVVRVPKEVRDLSFELKKGITPKTELCTIPVTLSLDDGRDEGQVHVFFKHYKQRDAIQRSTGKKSKIEKSLREKRTTDYLDFVGLPSAPRVLGYLRNANVVLLEFLKGSTVEDYFLDWETNPFPAKDDEETLLLKKAMSKLLELQEFTTDTIVDPVYWQGKIAVPELDHDTAMAMYINNLANILRGEGIEPEEGDLEKALKPLVKGIHNPKDSAFMIHRFYVPEHLFVPEGQENEDMYILDFGHAYAGRGRTARLLDVTMLMQSHLTTLHPSIKRSLVYSKFVKRMQKSKEEGYALMEEYDKMQVLCALQTLGTLRHSEKEHKKVVEAAHSAYPWQIHLPGFYEHQLGIGMKRLEPKLVSGLRETLSPIERICEAKESEPFSIYQ